MDTRKRFLAKIIQFWAIHEICMMADFGSRASSSFLLFTICLQRESRKVPFLNHKHSCSEKIATYQNVQKN